MGGSRGEHQLVALWAGAGGLTQRQTRLPCPETKEVDAEQAKLVGAVLPKSDHPWHWGYKAGCLQERGCFCQRSPTDHSVRGALV